MRQYNSSDCAFSCDEPYQDVGCGGVESDTLVQLYSYYTQSGESISAYPSGDSVGTSSLLNGATTSQIPNSVPSKETQGIWPTKASVTASSPLIIGVGVSNAISAEPMVTSSVLVPEPLPSIELLTTDIYYTNTPTLKLTAPEVDGTSVGPAINTPQISGLLPLQASVPAPVSSSSDAGPTAVSEPKGGSPTTPSITVATVVDVHYGEAFWVSILPFIQTGDLFEGYTLSSADADVDGFTLWWDPLDLGIGGIVWPETESTTWFIQVTMSRADHTIYYSFEIEINVSPSEASTPASNTVLAATSQSLAEAASLTEAASATQTNKFMDSSALNKPLLADDALASPVDLGSVAPTRTASVSAAANSSISLRDVYELSPGETFAIILTEVFDHSDDQLVSYTITTTPPGYNTSWVSYDASTSSLYGKAPDDTPNMTLLLTIVAAPSSSTKRQSGTYSFAIELIVRASSSGAPSLAPATTSSPSLDSLYPATNSSIGPSGIQPSPAVASSSVELPAGMAITTLTLTTYTVTLWTTITSYYSACPSCPVQSSIVQVPTATNSVVAELFTSSLILTVTGTCDDGSMTTQRIPTAILVAYHPLESSTSEAVVGDSTGTVLVAVTSTGLVHAPIGPSFAATNLTSGRYLNGSLTTADPVTMAPAPTRNSTAAPVVTSRVTSSTALTTEGLVTDSTSQPLVVITSTVLASASAAAQPMTAGASGRDGLSRVDIKAAIVFGVAVGISFLA